MPTIIFRLTQKGPFIFLFDSRCSIRFSQITQELATVVIWIVRVLHTWIVPENLKVLWKNLKLDPLFQ